MEIKGIERKQIYFPCERLHGDTFKAMEVGNDLDFHGAFNSHDERDFYINIPEGEWKPARSKRKAVELGKSLCKIKSLSSWISYWNLFDRELGLVSLFTKILEWRHELCKEYNALVMMMRKLQALEEQGKMFCKSGLLRFCARYYGLGKLHRIYWTCSNHCYYRSFWSLSTYGETRF